MDAIFFGLAFSMLLSEILSTFAAKPSIQLKYCPVATLAFFLTHNRICIWWNACQKGRIGAFFV
jgi:hypothetical protein